MSAGSAAAGIRAAIAFASTYPCMPVAPSWLKLLEVGRLRGPDHRGTDAAATPGPWFFRKTMTGWEPPGGKKKKTAVPFAVVALAGSAPPT